MTKLFLFIGHPRETSLSHHLADAYQRGAESERAEVRRMHLSDMDFDIDLTEGYHARKPLEPCLMDWRANLTWCDHTAWIYPYWWGGMPAKMKGVIDRAFLPGFAMQYHENDPWWDRLLKGRTGDVIITSDSPGFFDTLRYGAPGRKQIKRLVMEFSGIKVGKMKQFGTVKTAKPAKIARWSKAAYRMGVEAGRR